MKLAKSNVAYAAHLCLLQQAATLPLQVYIVFRFFVQYMCQGVWGAAIAFTFISYKSISYYSSPLLTNSLVLAAICGPVVFAAAFRFLQAMLRASDAEHLWYASSGKASYVAQCCPEPIDECLSH